jgi:hypothetical protein
MARVNSAVMLVGDYRRHSDRPGLSLIDTADQVASVPRDYAGQIFAGRVEVVGPAARARAMLH